MNNSSQGAHTYTEMDEDWCALSWPVPFTSIWTASVGCGPCEPAVTPASHRAYHLSCEGKQLQRWLQSYSTASLRQRIPLRDTAWLSLSLSLCYWNLKETGVNKLSHPSWYFVISCLMGGQKISPKPPTFTVAWSEIKPTLHCTSPANFPLAALRVLGPHISIF